MSATNASPLEDAARLTGESGSARPASVHPTLAAVARAVHEHSSEEARAALRPLGPGLVGTALPGIEISARLVALCVSTALASPQQQRITVEQRGRLDAARQTALYLLQRRRVGYAVAAVHLTEAEPRLCGTARWWVPALGAVGLRERFYRSCVATEHAADAVAVAALTSGGECDRRLWQLLRMCIAVTPSDASAPTAEEKGLEATRRRGDG